MRTENRSEDKNLKFKVGEIIKTEYIFKKKKKIDQKIIKEQNEFVGEKLELFNSFLRKANSFQEDVPRTRYGKKMYEKDLNEFLAMWEEIREYLPYFTLNELREFVRERVRTSNIERYLEIAEFLAKRDRPARFMIIVEENKHKKCFAIKKSGINKTFLRVLNSLISMRLIIKRYHYFRLFNIKVNSEKKEKAPTMSEAYLERILREICGIKKAVHRIELRLEKSSQFETQAQSPRQQFR